MTKVRKIGDDAWEQRCRRCARCCYEKVAYEGIVYYTDVPCEHLDLQTRLCRVYDERTRRRKGCLRLTPEVVGKGFLPADCPYAEGLEDYPAPVLFDEVE